MLICRTYHLLIKSQCLMEVRRRCNITGEKGNQILPTYLTHSYIMNKEFRIFIIYKNVSYLTINTKNNLSIDYFLVKKRTYDYVINK